MVSLKIITLAETVIESITTDKQFCLMKNGKEKEMKKTKSKKVIISLVSVLVLVIVCVVLAVHFGGSTNVEKYISKDLVAHGYNGYGKISESDIFDEDLFLEDMGREYYEWLSRNSYSDPLENSISIVFDKESNLSNGDTVTVEIRVNYDRINSKDFNKKLHGKEIISKTYTVSGLSEQVTIDLFPAMKSVNHKFGYFKVDVDTAYSEDINGFLVAYEEESFILRDPSGNHVATLNFFVDDDYTNENGEVTVVIKRVSNYYSHSYETIENKDYFADKGIILSQTKKDVKAVEWREITSADEIKGTVLDSIKERAVSEARSRIPENWDNISPSNIFYYINPEGETYILFFFAFTKEDSNERTETSFFEMQFHCPVTDGKNGDFLEPVFKIGKGEYWERKNYNETIKSYRSDPVLSEIRIQENAG